jgi:Fe2+ or Zn2+ uptake regulation protein
VQISVFLQTTEPISARELLYLIKEDNLFICFTTVYRTLKMIVACGLGKEVISAGAITRYVHDHCSHRHLVCKDCGAAVDVEEQNASKEAPGVSHGIADKLQEMCLELTRYPSSLLLRFHRGSGRVSQLPFGSEVKTWKPSQKKE